DYINHSSFGRLDLHNRFQIGKLIFWCLNFLRFITYFLVD
ncbi:MAG: hypothetical protein ACI9VN_003162, partial [Patescibacteria group bacterium]